ncbi:MAG: helix-turn-helix domain-containing protein [Candidatus Limivicinus sp.]|jgi:AraC-like DNA-binding protein
MQYQNTYRENLPSDFPEYHVRTHIREGNLDTKSSSSHWHDEMEVIYVRRGSGIQQIYNTFFAVEPGQLAVICPHQRHSFIPMTHHEDFDILVLQFDLKHVLGYVSQEKQFCREWLSGKMIFPRAIEADSFSATLMESIHDALHTPKSGYSCVVKGALLLLLAVLFHQEHTVLSADSKDMTDFHQRGLVDPVITFVSENYMRENLSVEEAANFANLSVAHFCRIFKQVTGMRFHEYLNLYRVIQAEHLFPTDKSLLEIAYECGFGSSSSFLRNYKKYRGVSPNQARKGKSRN